jgi:glycosyltransferase involved in cell wall biosynthesis
MEAMLCGAPTIVSDIPTHRWVMGDASLYCNPYDAQSIAAAMEKLTIGPCVASLRSELIARGRQQATRYSLEQCSRAWVDLLHRLKDESQARLATQTSRPALARPLEQAA